MTQMFGSAFLTAYGETPPSLWTQAISRLTKDQITRGLANLGNEGRSYPPNLTEFIEACKKIPERRFNGVEDRTDYKRLRRDRSTPEYAAGWITKMRAAVNSAEAPREREPGDDDEPDTR